MCAFVDPNGGLGPYQVCKLIENLSGWTDLNRRLSGPKPDALTKLSYIPGRFL